MKCNVCSDTGVLTLVDADGSERTELCSAIGCQAKLQVAYEVHRILWREDFLRFWAEHYPEVKLGQGSNFLVKPA
jgi:hypothetical protein